MSDGFWVALFSGMPGIIAAIGAIIIAIRQQQASKKLDQIHDLANGVSAKLVESTRAGAYAQGVLDQTTKVKADAKNAKGDATK